MSSLGLTGINEVVMLTQDTITKLRAVQEKIRNEPRQFLMHSFFSTQLKNDINGVSWRDYIVEGKYHSNINSLIKIPNCGTAACIAGWVVTISMGVNPDKAANSEVCTLSSTAVKAAGILNLKEEEVDRLFYFSQWPKRFRKFDDEGTEEFAQQAIKRIDHFIETDGKE